MRNSIDWTKVPEDLKVYELTMTDGKSLFITGTSKKGILTSRSQFVEIEDGTTLNKACIVGFYMDKGRSKEKITGGLLDFTGYLKNEENQELANKRMMPYLHDRPVGDKTQMAIQVPNV